MFLEKAARKKEATKIRSAAIDLVAVGVQAFHPNSLKEREERPAQKSDVLVSESKTIAVKRHDLDKMKTELEEREARIVQRDTALETRLRAIEILEEWQMAERH
ncbi:hypothetical protein E8E13_007765 [Curvularia kusanoi]|uniref:Uncharacterized protein n=1 Tax=Curvularia kusanoi TaxID=90978 RepID=A0A9P4TFM8_CURKU|nr:hypothetical protein E8E13_007765 [Curvularia kusanoi]